jgi:DNA polymerase zeta
MSADPRNTEKGGWIHEEEYRQLVNGLVQGERENRRSVTFETFVRQVEGEPTIRTAVESVEDLYPTNLHSQIPEEEEVGVQPGVVNQEVLRSLTDNLPPDDAETTAGALGDEDIDRTDTDDQSDAQEQSSLDPLSVSEASLFNSNSSKRAGFESDEATSSREAGNESQASESGTTLKRSRDSQNDEQPSKRQRILAINTGNSERHVTFDDGLSDEGAEHRGNIPKAQLDHRHPSGSQMSQTSIKAHGIPGSSPAGFPVVKNPQAPETIMRLSQSGYPNSQEIPKTPARKSLSSQPARATPSTPWSHQKSSSATSTDSSPKPSAEVLKLLSGLQRTSNHALRTVYYGKLPPPGALDEDAMIQAGLPPVIYQDAYYSNEVDVPDRPREYAGREFKLQSTTLPYLPPFDPTGTSLANFGENPSIVVDKRKEAVIRRLRSQRCRLRDWEIATLPPTFSEVSEWLQSQTKQADHLAAAVQERSKTKDIPKELSQIEGPTQKNKHGFKYSQKQQSTSVKHETQYMSILSVEVHVNSRGSLVPDPAEDEIQSIFWCIQGEEDGDEGRPRVGVLCLSDDDGIVQRISKQVSVEVEHEEDELDLINRMVDIVRQFDPDILTGYEVHNGSWGYLIERARLKYEFDLFDEISRMKSQSHGRFGKDADRWGFTHTSTIRVTGRHMINIWRAMRGELNLLQYTMENVVFHLLHKRIPHYSHADLTAWYRSSSPRDLSKVLNYFISRVQINLDILEANEIVPRTSEQARLLGVDFFSVISRGSQFKVESTMFRIAKPENFILVSPSRKQVGQQNALECLPLVMEPQSAFYTSPVLVLDFQSLYPSVMIAYNYCYSTCLGRIVSWRGRNKMGFMDFKREPQLLELVKDHINIAPNGMMYVKPEMRKSLLAKMLSELLETRVMVKSGMKMDKDDKTLQQLLNNRQLALKLLANVTYGYTSASFSGRMPCSEIADSIVQTGRETLEKAIAFIHSVERWGAEVVYGDTDSLFIHLKGRTRAQAFAIGQEISEAVTKRNPRPIKLKFEKVYHPCVLLAKKRYVGFKYESPSQTEPEFDAKGIETVRRDGTPAEQKIEETALKILFRTSDLSQVKAYFQDQCTKIMSGRISIQDFLFAKEVKLGTYSDRGPPPPGALIATKRMLADPRAEPQYGERIPYVVITGAPGARLIDRCVAPETLLQNDHIELDAEYYISKNLIPPLERIFNLVGANVRQWYDEMPKVQRIRNITVPFTKPDAGNGNALVAGAGGVGPTSKKSTLESYMKSSSCLVCRSKLPPPPTFPHIEPDALAVLPLCATCLCRPARALLALKDRVWKAEQRATQIDMVCRSCANLAWGEEIKCDSRDCPVFYTRIRERAKLAGLKEGVGKVIEVLEDEGDNDAEAVVGKGSDDDAEGVERGGLEW